MRSEAVIALPSAMARRTGWLYVAGAGLAVFFLCSLEARTGRVGPAERSVFHAINDLPQWLYPAMWLFEQVGNLVVALVLMLVIALVQQRGKLAGAAVVATIAKLGLERVVKMYVHRARPGTTIGNIVARGDVPLQGWSFVSGHAVITAAFATLLMPVFSHRWRMLPWVFVALNGVARVYVGAHNPLDIVGGIGLGVFIGASINVVWAATS